MRYVAVALAHAGDLATFLVGVSVLGIGAEANPLMRGAYAMDPSLAIALKAAGVAAMCLIILRLPRPLREVGTIMAIAFGAVGMTGNVLATLR